MEQADHSELFDQYLGQKLDDQAKADFEKRLVSKPDFKAAFTNYLLAQKQIYQAGYQEEKALFEQIKNRKLAENPSNPALKRKLYIGLAAAVVVLLISFFFLFPQSDSIAPEELFSTYYEVPEIPTTMSAAQDSLLRLADLHFANQKYLVASQAYGDLDKQQFAAHIQSRIFLFEGICAMEVEDWAKARNILAQATQHQEAVEWYTALTWLQVPGGADSTQILLQRIQKQAGHYYQGKAGELLGELE